MTFTLDPPSASSSTPADYHRIHFDPSALPSKRIVGLLACQRDPLLRKLRTKVVSVRPASLAAPPVSKGKEKKKKANGAAPSASTTNGTSTPTEPEGKLWEIEVEDTVIFPEGGGQPFDTGLIWLDTDSGRRSWKVEGCLRKKLDSVHLVRVPEDEAAIAEELAGQEVEVEVDWDRRMDHMALHTSQHLLSAVLDTFAEGLPTLSWSLSAYHSLEAPYVELPRALTWAEVAEVENKCNDLIKRDLKIWVDVDVQEEGYIKMTAAGVRENRGIPQDYTDGVIRHINIDGIDRNACCGTQLPSLSPLSFIHILPPSTPMYSDKPSKAASKLYFVSGPRAVSFLQQSSRVLSEAAQSLGTSRLELTSKVVKHEELRKESITKEKDLRAEIIRLVATSAISDSENSRGLYWVQRAEKGTHDFDFLGAVASAISDNQPSPGHLEAPVIVVSSAPRGIVPTLLMVTSPAADLAKTVYEKLKAALEGTKKGTVKGGGARGRFMAKVDGKWTGEEIAIVEGVLETLRDTKA